MAVDDRNQLCRLRLAKPAIAVGLFWSAGREGSLVLMDGINSEYPESGGGGGGKPLQMSEQDRRTYGYGLAGKSTGVISVRLARTRGNGRREAYLVS